MGDIKINIFYFKSVLDTVFINRFDNIVSDLQSGEAVSYL